MFNVAEFIERDYSDFQSESFNHLFEHDIPSIVRSYGKTNTLIGTKKHSISFENLVVHNNQPNISDCIDFGLASTVSLVCDLVLRNVTVETENMLNNSEGVALPNAVPVVVSRVRTVIAKIPIPVGKTSLSVDAFDDRDMESNRIPSGAFVVNGKLRGIPPVKSVSSNFPLLLDRKDSFLLQFRSVHADKSFRSTSTLEVYIEKSPKRLSHQSTVFVRLPFKKTALHIGDLAHALGSKPDEFNVIVKNVAGKLYNLSIFRAYEISNLYLSEGKSVSSSVLLISKMYGRNIASTGENVLNNEIFPHCRKVVNDEIIVPDSPETRYMKIVQLAKLVVSLILFRHGILSSISRDDYLNTTITTGSMLIGQLFRLSFISHMSTFSKLARRALMAVERKQAIDRELGKARDPDVIDLISLYGENRLSSRILSAFASGRWSALRTGVTMTINNNNTDALVSQMRRVSSSLTSTDGQHTAPREVRADQFGYICAASSPSGEGTGLVYELGCTASITHPMTQIEHLNKLIVLVLGDSIIPIPNVTEESFGERLLYINPSDRITHLVVDVDLAVARVRNARRRSTIPAHVFIRLDFQTMCFRIVGGKGGLLIRPLAVFEKVHTMVSIGLESSIGQMSLEQLYINGVIEDLSPVEESCREITRVATSYSEALKFSLTGQKVTHFEVTQAAFLDLISASVPYATSQQGPRLSIFGSQVKQFMTSELDTDRRGAVSVTKLNNCFRDLVTSVVAKSRPGGDQGRYVPLVLAMIALPDCQEDAIIFNKSTLERGAMSSDTTQIYVSDAATSTALFAEKFEKRDDVLARKHARYDNVTESGLPVVGTRVQSGDVIIAKTRSSKQTFNNTLACRDISTVVKDREGGRVSISTITKMPTGVRCVVGVETNRLLKVGDKLSTRSSQKGVCGAIWPQEDIPFSMKTGCAPDIIVSPLSMTSRMTMSALLEAIMGKTVSITGDLELGVDKQDFNMSNKVVVKKMENLLRQHGFSSSGKEVYIDGRTGKMLNAMIFTGIVSYARLIHIAEKKAHVRSTGPRDLVTRQPRDGRRFHGGLRLGEMETAGLVAHGASSILKERVSKFSDGTDMFVCSECNTISDISNPEINFFYCEKCESRENIKRVVVPFTLIVLIAELFATGIDVTLIVGEDDQVEVRAGS